jgi:hypothetical protein
VILFHRAVKILKTKQELHPGFCVLPCLESQDGRFSTLAKDNSDIGNALKFISLRPQNSHRGYLEFTNYDNIYPFNYQAKTAYNFEKWWISWLQIKSSLG